METAIYTVDKETVRNGVIDKHGLTNIVKHWYAVYASGRRGNAATGVGQKMGGEGVLLACMAISTLAFV